MLLILSACAPAGTDDFWSTDRRAFDASVWATSGERWSMCGDLRRHHLRIGMARDEVLVLLGPPREDDAAGLHYDVGSYWLDVLFDARGQLTETLLNSY